MKYDREEKIILLCCRVLCIPTWLRVDELVSYTYWITMRGSTEVVKRWENLLISTRHFITGPNHFIRSERLARRSTNRAKHIKLREQIFDNLSNLGPETWVENHLDEIMTLLNSTSREAENEEENIIKLMMKSPQWRHKQWS